MRHGSDLSRGGVVWSTSAATRRAMQGNRRRDTRPEMALRAAAHARGLRYRVDVCPAPGLRRRADLVFPRLKIAVYVDGCFWHGCSQHFALPRTNTDYWRAKIAGNVARDRQTDNWLGQQGWTVFRVWEHQDPHLAAAELARLVRDKGADHA